MVHQHSGILVLLLHICFGINWNEMFVARISQFFSVERLLSKVMEVNGRTSELG